MTARDITAHYSRVDILDRLAAELGSDGVAPEDWSIATLAPYDHFHGRGLEATEEVAAALAARPGMRILDAGSGIGGPARWIAHKYGCRVTGVDLTSGFVAAATALSARLGMSAVTDFEVADALQLPFSDATFDGAYSMNVAMNIADKAGFYRSLHRVLKPGSTLVLSEIARGEGEIRYPMPWAETAAASFLSTAEETRDGLVAAGFDVLGIGDTRAKALAFGARSREIVERGGRPPHRAVILIHGDVARDAMTNSARALRDGATVPIEVVARKR